jgi:cell division FtsZ-interacting protein ZapD
LVTKANLEKKLKKYKEEMKQLAGVNEADSALLRMFRKRVKRTQRKLASMVRNGERIAGKGKGEKKAPSEKSES